MNQITLFERNGVPVAYIDYNEDGAIYSFSGKPLAYLSTESDVYSFNGKHLGWFEDGIVWDHHGRQVGFVEETCPALTQLEPFKGFQQFQPFRGFPHFPPFKPFKLMAYSNIGLSNFLQNH